MSYGRDFGAPEAAHADPLAIPAGYADADFVGPLRPADQAWAERTLHADHSAALFEPADNVIRRREAHIGSLYRAAALLSLGGDLAGGSTTGFRAIAESRALAEFLAASPAYCLDCFVLGERCQQHRGTAAGRGGAGPSAPGSAGPSAPGSADGGGARSGRTGTGPGGRATYWTGGGPGGGTGGARPAPGHQPEWRRFGAREFPSADG